MGRRGGRGGGRGGEGGGGGGLEDQYGESMRSQDRDSHQGGAGRGGSGFSGGGEAGGARGADLKGAWCCRCSCLSSSSSSSSMRPAMAIVGVHPIASPSLHTKAHYKSSQLGIPFPAVASHVPAFLKAHAHLLHGKARKESEPVVDQGPDDDSDFERDDGVRLLASPLCDSGAQTC